jgi:hypothetical protein
VIEHPSNSSTLNDTTNDGFGRKQNYVVQAKCNLDFRHAARPSIFRMYRDSIRQCFYHCFTRVNWKLCRFTLRICVKLIVVIRRFNPIAAATVALNTSAVFIGQSVGSVTGGFVFVS